MKTLVNSVDQLAEYKHVTGMPIAVDVETASTGCPLSVQIAWSPVDAISIDMAHLSGRDIEPILHRNSCMFHYGVYDILQLERIGVSVMDMFDTYVCARLVNYDKHDGFGLKYLARTILGMEMKDIEEVSGKKGKDIRMEDVPMDQLVEYGCDDALATYRLAEYYRTNPWVASHLRLVMIESQLQGVVARMKKWGILFDRSISAEFRKEIDLGMKEIQEQISCPLGSNDLVSRYLFQKLGLSTEGIKKNKNGLYSVAHEYLDRIKYLHPHVPMIMEWRALAKLQSTYTSSYANCVQADGAIRSTFDSFGASTGRFASSGPNLQNVPAGGRGKMMRKAFHAREGYTLVSVDYKQIELIVLAVLAGEDNMLSIIRRGGDLHRRTAAIIYDIPESLVTKDQRGHAKTINFGLVYGGGPGLLLPFTGGNWDRAHDLHKTILGAYPKLKPFFDACGGGAFRGYSETYWGRRRSIGKYHKDMTPQKKSGLFRVAINSVIQGTAADILKLAMCVLDTDIDPQEVHILLQIHDELILEVKTNNLDNHITAIKMLMEAAFQYMKVDVEIGQNWYEMTEYNPLVATVSERVSPSDNVTA